VTGDLVYWWFCRIAGNLHCGLTTLTFSLTGHAGLTWEIDPSVKFKFFNFLDT